MLYVSFGFFFSTPSIFKILLVALIIPLHLFAMFCQYHTLYFVSKALKSVKLKRKANFRDYGGDFALLWLFIFGIWIIQPRINKLFDKNDVLDNAKSIY